MARTVQCVILKREAEGLETPPLPGDFGKRIFDSVSKEAWDRWVAQQTIIINEYRLNLADPRAQALLTEAMERFFYGGGLEPPPDWVPPEERPENQKKDSAE